MNKAFISPFELGSMMLLFLTGSTIVVGLNFSAMEGSILAIPFEVGFGIGLFYFYLLIMKKSGWKDFLPLLEMGFGSFLCKILAVLYSMYFLYIAARVLNDFSFFTTQILYPDSLKWVAAVPFLLVAGYCAMLGIEAIARSAIIMTFFSFIILIALWLLGFLSDEFQATYLMPLFAQGFKPIQKMIFPTGLTFPFGELVVYLVLLPLVHGREKLKKTAWIPITIAGVILMITMELVIGILHAPFANTYYFPFVKAMEMVTYLDLVEHLEIFTYLLLIGGGFMKISVFLYAARSVLTQLFQVKQKNWHVILLLVAVYLLSLHRSSDITDPLYVGLKLVPYYLHIPIQFIIPLVLGVVVFWRGRKVG
ncbi:GerAB/ArcD/ProY family transporter [Bacillus sp. KH172YL63]|uniref:GerAB/ArcD/ProY family transporter n=1 Tax=Bacillus sp. KH172YL63 TaxID=2709784 RepID=UPI0013E4CEFC|nr:GerAB/ArcD/ProY family transporter [Bacillus sp. KH172YL63]BCB04143.1 spore germination protein KB [Bacillus sp. KH172YL63]